MKKREKWRLWSLGKEIKQETPETEKFRGLKVSKAKLVPCRIETTHHNSVEKISILKIYFCQRPLAPQGSTRPLLETGNPISPAVTVPPYFFTITVLII